MVATFRGASCDSDICKRHRPCVVICKYMLIYAIVQTCKNIQFKTCQRYAKICQEVGKNMQNMRCPHEWRPNEPWLIQIIGWGIPKFKNRQKCDKMCKNLTVHNTTVTSTKNDIYAAVCTQHFADDYCPGRLKVATASRSLSLSTPESEPN